MIRLRTVITGEESTINNLHRTIEMIATSCKLSCDAVNSFEISPHTQYTVGIALSGGFRGAIKGIGRFDARLMKLTIISADCTFHFFTAYAPQAGRPDTEKDAFWQLLDAKTCNVPADDTHDLISGQSQYR